MYSNGFNIYWRVSFIVYLPFCTDLIDYFAMHVYLLYLLVVIFAATSKVVDILYDYDNILDTFV
jgi:hypothetical protein